MYVSIGNYYLCFRVNNAYHTTPGIDGLVVFDMVATDRNRKFLLDLQICNLHREERTVLSLLPFILYKRKEIKGCDLRCDTRVLYWNCEKEVISWD